MLKTIDQRSKYGIALVVVLLVIKFALVPIFDWQKEKLGSLQHRVELLAKQQSTINSVERFKDIEVEYKTRLGEWREFFYDSQNVSNFPVIVAEQIESIATEKKLEIVRNTWGEPRGDAIKSLSMKIVLKGQFSQAASFIESIESLEKVFVINSVYFTYNIRRPGEVNLLLELVAFGTDKGQTE